MNSPQYKLVNLLHRFNFYCSLRFDKIIMPLHKQFLNNFRGYASASDNIIHAENMLFGKVWYLVGQFHAHVLFELDRGNGTMKNFDLN